MRIPLLRIPGLPPLRISAGTLLTVALLAVIVHPAIAATGLSPGAAAAVAAEIGLMMVLSVLVHEMAHALLARSLGAQVDHIALTLWGGHTQYRTARRSGLASAGISLAGPASNLVLAGMLWSAARLVDLAAPSILLGYAAWLNVVLAVFNLLPGLPMDGGRALESLLGLLTRRPVMGTLITAWCGRLIAVLVIAYPLWLLSRAAALSTSGLLMLLWAVLIAGMLWSGAGTALEQTRVQQRVDALSAREMLLPVVLVAPSATVEQLEQLLQDTRPEPVQESRHRAGPGRDPVLLVLEEAPGPRRAIGTAQRIDPRLLASVPPARRDGTPVTALGSALGTVGVLDAELTGQALVSAMLNHPHPVYLVHGAEQVLGVIMSADVNAYLRGR